MSFPTNPSSFDTYGGAKVDYVAVVDPRTDRSAEEVNAAFCDTAAMTRTSCQAFVQFVGGAGPSIVPSTHRALWGSSIAVIPTVERTAAGVYAVTWPGSVTTELAEEADVNLTMGEASREGSTFGFQNATKLSPNSFEVRTADSTGTPDDLDGVTISLRVW